MVAPVLLVVTRSAARAREAAVVGDPDHGSASWPSGAGEEPAPGAVAP